MRPALMLAAALALPLPAAGMEPLQGLADPDAVADLAANAAGVVTEKAKDTLLVREMLGREITGPGGETVGTLGNLVVVPGGRIAAIVVLPGSGDPLVLPYQALKLSAAASAGEAVGLSLPMDLEEARGLGPVQDLTAAVLGDGTGSSCGGCKRKQGSE
ncbi:MAG TPA: hypothetical protein VMM55_07075 [Thermohalobaculum sp.]|nr:hypothetical protein [Thermohalobaculum sp.]